MTTYQGGPEQQRPEGGQAGRQPSGPQGGYGPPTYGGQQGYGGQQQPPGPPPTWGPQQPYGGRPPQAPTNSWALVALVLGIITVALSPIPILNQAGILVGFVAVGLSIPAIVIGLRGRVRVVMAFIAAGLAVLGLILSFVFTDMFVKSINQIGSPLDSSTSGGVAVTTSTDAPAAAKTFTLKVEGTAKRATVYYSVNGSSGGGDKVSVPWTNTQDDKEDFGYATVSANTDMGQSGSVSCSITDETGKVLDQKTATSQGGSFGSANVNCSANRTD